MDGGCILLYTKLERMVDFGAMNSLSSTFSIESKSASEFIYFVLILCEESISTLKQSRSH